jgi:hypothetical protein
MIDADDFATVRLSTAGLPEQDRLALWRKHYGRMIHRVEIEPLPGISFDAALLARTLPGLQVVSEAMSPACVARTRDLIADGDDDLAIVINRAGALVASARGREVALCEGDAVLMSSSDIAALHRSSFGGSISLRIPRSLLSLLVADIDGAIMHLIPRHTAGLELLTSYASALPNDGALATPELRRMVVAHVHGLVALMLGAARGAGGIVRRRGMRAGRLSSAANLSDSP